MPKGESEAKRAAASPNCSSSMAWSVVGVPAAAAKYSMAICNRSALMPDGCAGEMAVLVTTSDVGLVLVPICQVPGALKFSI